MSLRRVSEPVDASRTSCVACMSAGLEPVIDLGVMPLVDRLVEPTHAGEPDPAWPLRVGVCVSCGLAQLIDRVDPVELFATDFPYYSSVSRSFVAHAHRQADALTDRLSLVPGDLAVEIGSNDGYMLRRFKERGMRVLGIDPASGPADVAIESGVPTLVEFFSQEMGERIIEEHGQARVIAANNVLAHTPDLDGVVRGIRSLLAPDGVASIEVAYLRDLVELGSFDTIYHEHHCYFTVSTLAGAFERRGMRLIDAERIGVHGGSLRVLVAHEGEPSARAQRLVDEERTLGCADPAFLVPVQNRIDLVRSSVNAYLDDRIGEGATIAAYGAAAKGAVMLNVLGLTTDRCAFVADRNVHKQGRLVPGVRVPIVPPDRLLSDRPDCCLLLAWNFAQEIADEQRAFADGGGRFVVPIPDVRELA